MIPTIHPLTGYCERHSPGREFGGVYVNQPVTNMTRERSRASGTTRSTLKTVHYTTPFSFARPLDMLHFGILDDAGAMLFHLRTPFPGTRFGVRAELRVPKIRERVYGVCVAPIWVGFGLFSSPRSQKIINFRKSRTQNGPNVPRSSIFFLLGLVFWVSNQTVICCWPGQPAIASGE